MTAIASPTLPCVGCTEPTTYRDRLRSRETDDDRTDPICPACRFDLESPLWASFEPTDLYVLDVS